MNVVRFELIELPYPTLARFGLTQEMIEDLPMRVLDEICDGRHSPVLPVRVRDEKGELIESRSRFALVRRDDGLSDVVFYPVLESSPLERYDEAQQKQLLAGKAILADVETADGRHSKAFVQIDEETKQVMYIPTPIIGRNLQVLADIMHLGTMEVNSMQNGEPLTLVVDDEPVTVGIDLHDKTGIRFCSGDSQKWKEQPKREWDKYILTGSIDGVPDIYKAMIDGEANASVELTPNMAGPAFDALEKYKKDGTMPEKLTLTKSTLYLPDTAKEELEKKKNMGY